MCVCVGGGAMHVLKVDIIVQMANYFNDYRNLILNFP